MPESPPKLKESALWYAGIGWNVIALYAPKFDTSGACIGCSCEEWRRRSAPDYICPTPGKHPRLSDWEAKATTNQATIENWWRRWPNANVGIAAGKSGLVVVDADTYHEMAEGGRLALTDKETVTNLTGGGGEHYVYKHPAEGPLITNSDSSLPEWVNIRAHGGQFVVPPSLHKSGRRYAWEPGYGPHEFEPAALAKQLCELLQGETGARQRALPIPERIPEGKRHTAVVSLAGTMRRRGMGAAGIEAGLLATNDAQFDPPMPEEELHDIAMWAADQEPGVLLSSNGSEAPKPDGDPPKGWTVVLADALCMTNDFAISDGGELHYYARGRYRPGGKGQVKRQVKQTLVSWGRESIFTGYRANEVISYISADAPRLWTMPPAGKINLINGILDIDKRELLPHTPEHLSTLQIPVEYRPGAEPAAWERRIGEWFPADAQQTPWQLLAWLIRPDIKLQIAALLLGDGENGKSRFLAAIRAFLGSQNVAALSLQQIETSRWATHRLNGKLANICPDLPAQHLETSSIFKALTGGDLLAAEVKHGDLYEYRPFVRLLFSANQPPVSKDASRAFFRRWLVIPFDATFSAEERKPEAAIDAELASPAELSGALNRALDAMADLESDGISETSSMREAHREFHEVTDPVEVWLDTSLVEHSDAFIVKGDLVKSYNEAARVKGWTVLTAGQFGRRVKEWRPNISDGQRRISDRRPTTWEGIGLRDE
jgi:P4 family phage/plasmid primase-like protien